MNTTTYFEKLLTLIFDKNIIKSLIDNCYKVAIPKNLLLDLLSVEQFASFQIFLILSHNNLNIYE